MPLALDLNSDAVEDAEQQYGVMLLMQLVRMKGKM